MDDRDEGAGDKCKVCGTYLCTCPSCERDRTCADCGAPWVTRDLPDWIWAAVERRDPRIRF